MNFSQHLRKELYIGKLIEESQKFCTYAPLLNMSSKAAFCFCFMSKTRRSRPRSGLVSS